MARPKAKLSATTVAESDPWEEMPATVRADLDRLLAVDDWPGLARLAATGALQPLGLEPADLASPAALGQALVRPETYSKSAPEAWSLVG